MCKRFLWSCVALLLVMSCNNVVKSVPIPLLQVDSTGNEAALFAKGYVLSFEENFSADLSKWNIWNGGAYNNELELYQSPNLVVAGGHLTITAKNETVTGSSMNGSGSQRSFSYTSGRIESKYLFSLPDSATRIRVSARIKLPQGYGMWPAFWSYGDPWPTHGEIDILEAKGQNPISYTTNYFYGPTPGVPTTNNSFTVSMITSTADLSKDYHIYEVEYSKNALNYYLDGNLIDKKTSTSLTGNLVPGFFGMNERVVLNLAVGGNYFGSTFDPSQIVTGSMFVDWVRVYTIK